MRITSCLPLLALCALVGASGQAGAQGDFEGTVTYTMSGQGMPALEMVNYVKGERLRMEVNGPMGPMVMLADAGGHSMTMLMPAQRAYMTIDVAAMAAQSGAAAASGDLQIDITATGQSDTIAGHTCEYYLLKAEGQEVEICAAKGLGFYMLSAGGSPPGGRNIGLSPAQAAELKARFAEGFFPLKMIMSGGPTLEARRIERKTLAASLFEVPEGYTEMKMPGMR